MNEIRLFMFLHEITVVLIEKILSFRLFLIKIVSDTLEGFFNKNICVYGDMFEFVLIHPSSYMQ